MKNEPEDNSKIVLIFRGFLNLVIFTKKILIKKHMYMYMNVIQILYTHFVLLV